MEKKVKALLDRKLSRISSNINKDWFYEFFNLFFKYNYQGEINAVIEAFFNTEEINRIEIDPPKILLNKTKCPLDETGKNSVAPCKIP